MYQPPAGTSSSDAHVVLQPEELQRLARLALLVAGLLLGRADVALHRRLDLLAHGGELLRHELGLGDGGARHAGRPWSVALRMATLRLFCCVGEFRESPARVPPNRGAVEIFLRIMARWPHRPSPASATSASRASCASTGSAGRCVVRGAFPGFTPPVDRAGLFRLAARDEVESRLVVRRGRRWSLRRRAHSPGGTLPPRRQPGWTLLVQGLDLVDDGAHATACRGSASCPTRASTT